MSKGRVFKIELKLDDAAQKEDTEGAVANILEDIARRFRRGEIADKGTGKIYDVNGNSIGIWKMSK